ncbi:MAG: protein translocase subunit SecD [Holophagaceae bacterium]|nr:protein translocase subunit SecD [Holophagaceae bacterium]
MSKRTIWRLALTIITCIGCSYFFLPVNKIRLGLDLAGGVEFTMEVQGHEALVNDLTDTRDKLYDRFREKSIPASARLEEDRIVVTFSSEHRPGIEGLLKEFYGYQTSFDDTGVVLVQRASYQTELKNDANKRALQIIENRVNATGVAEPEIKQAGEEGNRIIVELPGLAESEIDRIKALLQTPGKLEQRLIATQNSRVGWPTIEEALAHFNGQLPEGTELIPELESDRDLRRSGQTPVKSTKGQQKPEVIKAWHLVELKSFVDGADITRAMPGLDPLSESHEIHFSLNSKGADDFHQLTKIASSENRQIAILLDKKLVSALGCSNPIIGGSVRITGSFSKEDAEDFALKLKSGSMRASMKYLEERSMGASLGADSIRAGVRASLFGFATIVAFMLFFYHWSGINAIVALTVNLIIMMGLMGSFNAVITLPGIAGFALTLGMAIDANILIFERIKEELSLGKSVAGAIQAGFDRVFWTIVDSHVTQLFASLLLFIFGTGPVKGFAVALTVGVTASLFTSIYISRWIYDWILERRPNTKEISVGTHKFFAETKIDFMKYKNWAFAISWGIIFVCLFVAQPWKGHDSRVKLGMQFVGGLDMVVRYKGDITAESIRAKLTEGGFADANVVNYKGSELFHDYSVKVPARKGQDEKDAVEIKKQVIVTLRNVDPDSQKDSRPDLNSEETKDMLDFLVEKDPLNLQGDDAQKLLAYTEHIGSNLADIKAKGQGFVVDWNDLENLPKEIKDFLIENYRLGNLSVQSSQSFSPSVAGEWTKKTLTAVAWALGAILAYVMFRFSFSFSVSTIIGLVHDMLLGVGLFTLFGYEYSVAVVASFLILLGYSTSDTIVVFDRVRENIKKPEYRRVKVGKLINDSINQTLSRTILTSASTLTVALCLFLLGGPALHDLSFPIVLGVIIGPFSTIYIAAPIVVYIDKLFGGKDKIKQHA